MTKLVGNAVVGQSGGPTAAINATLAGVIKGSVAANKEGTIKTLYGMKNGERFGINPDPIFNSFIINKLVTYVYILIITGLVSWFIVWWLLLLLGRSNSISKKDYWLLLGSLWAINFISVSSTMAVTTSKTFEQFMKAFLPTVSTVSGREAITSEVQLLKHISPMEVTL